MSTLISKASLLLVPSVYEDGTLYNVLPSGNKAPDKTGNNNGYDQTRADFTFSRGSNLSATRIGPSGLIEKGRENLILQSNSFDNWSKSNSSVTGGQSGYDGTNDAYKLVSNTSNAGHRVFQAQVQTGVLTFSIYAKAGGYDFMFIYINGKYAYFDLANGSVGTESGLIDSSIAAAGNDFYRCSITFSGVTTSNVEVYIANTGSSYVFTGDGTSGIFIQDAQFEQSMVATDYIETGSVSGTAGVLENTPRIDYSSGAGALLLEPSRTNLITQSEYFGAWTASGLTISSNEATSPEGVSNAAKLTLPSGSAIKRIALGSMPVTAVARSYSFFVKSDDISAIQLVHSGDVQGYARFDISSGVVGSKGSKTTSDIEDYGNGWYRCIANFDATNSFGSTIYLYINDSATGGYGGSTNAQGDLFVFGAQYEEASYPSSYVPTYGSAATRGADVCKDAGNSDVFNDSEGVLFVEMSALADDNENRIVSISDGTTSTRVLIQYYTSSNTIRGFVQGGGVSATLSYTSSDITANTKIAFKYKSGDHALWVNGTERNTASTAITLSGLDDFSFDNGAGAAGMYANVKQAIVFNEALSDSELATLTTL